MSDDRGRFEDELVATAQPVAADPAAGGRLNAARDRLAGQVESAAESLALRAGAHAVDRERLARYEARAANWLEQGALRVRELDVQAVEARARQQLAGRPGAALGIAAGAGFLLGLLLGRR